MVFHAFFARSKKHVTLHYALPRSFSRSRARDGIVKLLRAFILFYFILFPLSFPLIAIREIVGTDTIGRKRKRVFDVENVLDSSTW